MHEREEGWGLTDDGSGGGDGGSVVAREAGASLVTARKAGASPVTARKVASMAAPVALTRPRGSVALGVAPVSSMVHGSAGARRRRRRSVGRRIGETAARARGGFEGFGGSGSRGGNGFLAKSNLAVARLQKCAIAKLAIALSPKRAAAIANFLFCFYSVGLGHALQLR